MLQTDCKLKYSDNSIEMKPSCDVKNCRRFVKVQLSPIEILQIAAMLK